MNYRLPEDVGKMEKCNVAYHLRQIPKIPSSSLFTENIKKTVNGKLFLL